MSIKFTFYNNVTSLTTDSIPICILPKDSMLFAAVNFPGADKDCIRIEVSDPLSAVKCVRKLWNNVTTSPEIADYLQIHDNTPAPKINKITYVYNDDHISITSAGILIDKNNLSILKISALVSVEYNENALVFNTTDKQFTVVYSDYISDNLKWKINKAIMQFMI